MTSKHKKHVENAPKKIQFSKFFSSLFLVCQISFLQKNTGIRKMNRHYKSINVAAQIYFNEKKS